MATPATIHNVMADLWNRRDFDSYKQLFHSEYTYTGPDGKEIAGGPDVALGVAQLYAKAFPDATLEVKRVYTQGDTAIAEMFAQGTHGGDLMGLPATGKPVQITICNVMELRDGQVLREREYMDMFSMLAQIGAVGAPGQAAGGS
jgi:steroid delta-isomerase-like uncharacterized protein